MAQALANPPAGFEELPVEEQIEYVQALWDRIAAREGTVPVPEWHRAELDGRLADLAANPSAGVAWEDLQAELRGRDSGVR